MYNSLSKWAVLGLFGVNVYPLVVKCGIGKCVNAVLVNFEPVRLAMFLSMLFFKFFVRVDSQHVKCDVLE